MYLGWVIAFIAGLITPATVIFFGDVFDSFDYSDPTNPDYDLLVQTMQRIMFIFLGFAALIFLTIFSYMSLLSSFSVKASKDIKAAYLHAMLSQDCPWYDSVNQGELSSKISTEVA